MSFKKFVDFIAEGSSVDSKKKDIEEVSAKPVGSDIPQTCPKCGESVMVCDCYIDDYYDARNPQYAPKGKTIKRDNKKKLK
jgi:hypothetical protein